MLNSPIAAVLKTIMTMIFSKYINFVSIPFIVVQQLLSEFPVGSVHGSTIAHPLNPLEWESTLNQGAQSVSSMQFACISSSPSRGNSIV